MRVQHRFKIGRHPWIGSCQATSAWQGLPDSATVRAGAQPMNSWTALLYLYLGLWFVSFIINIYLLYRPIAGPPSTVWA